MGVSALRVLQFGKETTWGTSTTAGAIFSGLEDFSGTPVYTNTQRRYLDGSYKPAQAVVQTDTRGAVTMSGDFTFEDMIYVLSSAVKGAVSAVGASTNKTWGYPFPLTASPAVEGRTLEISDGQQEYEMAGGVVEKFTLSGDTGTDSTVKFTADWIGKTFVSSTLTGSLTPRTTEALSGAMCKLYIDALGGTVGTTLTAATFVSWNFEYTTGIHLKKFGDGSNAPSTFGYGVPTISLQLTLEYNATGVAEVAALMAGTGRLVKILGTGTLITGAEYKTLTIEMAGDYTTPPKLWDDRDGNTIVSLTLTPRHDAGAFAKYGNIVIQNAIATAVG